MTIYEQLKKAAGMADVIEAAECGYVALDDKSISHLNNKSMEMMIQISAEQFKKLSGAATPESNETR